MEQERSVLEIRPGTLVSSLAGHDKGKLFVIVALEGEEFYLLADGRTRKIEKPKKKKAKHVRLTGICLEDIATKLEKHDKITNADLRKAFQALDVVDLT